MSNTLLFLLLLGVSLYLIWVLAYLAATSAFNYVDHRDTADLIIAMMCGGTALAMSIMVPHVLPTLLVST